MCGGVSPEAPLAPLTWKNHVTAKIVRVAANILHVLAYISRVVADKAVEEAKSCWPMNFFFHFWGFFQKVFKKWSSFRKKLLHFFPLPLGGSDPKVEIFTLFFYFFLNPSLNDSCTSFFFNPWRDDDRCCAAPAGCLIPDRHGCPTHAL